MPAAARASAASSVGTSRLLSRRRRSTEPSSRPDDRSLQAWSRGAGSAFLGSRSCEEDLEDLPDDRRRRRPAVPAVLDDDREGDLRVLRRRVSDEPGVVALGLRELVGVDATRLLEDLRGAGLSGDADRAERGLVAPSPPRRRRQGRRG